MLRGQLGVGEGGRDDIFEETNFLRGREGNICRRSLAGAGERNNVKTSW